MDSSFPFGTSMDLDPALINKAQRLVHDPSWNAIVLPEDSVYETPVHNYKFNTRVWGKWHFVTIDSEEKEWDGTVLLKQEITRDYLESITTDSSGTKLFLNMAPHDKDEDSFYKIWGSNAFRHDHVEESSSDSDEWCTTFIVTNPSNQ